jgi:excisionase family DNA binding protein
MGLPGLAFSYIDAKKAIEALATDEKGSVSVREAALRTGVSPRVAYKLIRDGHLATVSDGSHLEARILTASLDRFLGAHISVSELSKRLGVSKMALRKRIHSGWRYEPSVCFEKDGPQFFSRSAVESPV